ncbi:MAG: DUF86 domain-containing protein [Planctomycetota bacterium]|nr:DUF86 domain-containing protein [Planctomycetota bacterium]
MPPELPNNPSPGLIPDADRIRLRHMLEAARDALQFAGGRQRSDLDSDRLFRRGVLDCIQEIGEAAVQVSPECRDRVPGVPWRQIVGMRHRLVHVYFDINLDLVWEVLARDLDPLAQALKLALAPSTT